MRSARNNAQTPQDCRLHRAESGRSTLFRRPPPCVRRGTAPERTSRRTRGKTRTKEFPRCTECSTKPRTKADSVSLPDTESVVRWPNAASDTVLPMTKPRSGRLIRFVLPRGRTRAIPRCRKRNNLRAGMQSGAVPAKSRGRTKKDRLPDRIRKHRQPGNPDGFREKHVPLPHTSKRDGTERAPQV